VVIRGLANTPVGRGNLAVGACILTLGVITWALGAWRLSHSRVRAHRRTSTADLLPISIGAAAIGLSALVLCLVAPA
jgi:hypothetical protein